MIVMIILGNIRTENVLALKCYLQRLIMMVLFRKDYVQNAKEGAGKREKKKKVLCRNNTGKVQFV